MILGQIKKYLAAVVAIAVAGLLVMISLFYNPLPPTVHAQYSQVITQTLLTNAHVTPGNVAGGPITNIGQNTHYLSVSSNDAPGHTCIGVFSAQILGAYNTVALSVPLLQFLVGAQTANTTTSEIRYYQAFGAAPALYLYFQNADSTNCVYTAQYTGLVSGGGGSGVITGPVAPAIAGAGGFNPVQLSSAVFSTSSSGDTQVFTTNTSTLLAVYGLQLCNATAAQTVIFKNAAGAGTVYAKYPNMAAGQCVVLPTGQTPVFPVVSGGLAPNNSLFINLANATEVDLTMWYRLE